MIADFEQRLADLLGARLPAPFTGRVQRAPAPAASAQPEVSLGVVSARSAQSGPAGRGLGARQRFEVVPGAAEPRRVLRLAFDVAIAVQAASGAGRRQVLAGLEAAAYTLDTADVRDGSALASEDDLGFQVSRLELGELRVALDPLAVPELLLAGEGWFWPVGQAGQAGVAIREIQARSVALPIQVEPARARLVAGGDDVLFTLRFGGARQRIGAAPALPFGSVALALAGPGGRAGAGQLAGGAAGVAGVRLVTLVEGAATITYAPPADAAQDELVVALDDGAGGLGVPLARIALPVVSP